MSSLTKALTFGLLVFALGFLVGRSQPAAWAQAPTTEPGLGDGVILETGDGMLRLASESPDKTFVMFANAAGEEAAAELAAIAAEPPGELREWHFPLDRFDTMTIGVVSKLVQVQGLAGRDPEMTAGREPIPMKDCHPGVCTPPADGLVARFYPQGPATTAYCSYCCTPDPNRC